MLAPRHAIAKLHSDFYRDQYYRLLHGLMVLVVIMYLLLGIIVYLILFQPASSFYASTTNGKILPMHGVQNGTGK